MKGSLTKLEIVSWLLFFCSSDDDCLVVISREFLLEMEGVEKALLPNSLMPSLIMLREVSFLMWIVSLDVMMTFKYSHCTEDILLTFFSRLC